METVNKNEHIREPGTGGSPVQVAQMMKITPGLQAEPECRDAEKSARR